MISRQEYEQARLRAAGCFRKAGIVLDPRINRFTRVGE
jgi:hypothetical protein